MKAIINDYYGVTHPHKADLVGREIEVEKISEHTYRSKVAPETWWRSFDAEEIDIQPEEDLGLLKVTFKHFSANERNHHGSWWMWYGGERFGIPHRELMNLFVMRHEPEMDGIPQDRLISKETFRTLTERSAGQQFINQHPEIFGVPEYTRRMRGSLGR